MYEKHYETLFVHNVTRFFLIHHALFAWHIDMSQIRHICDTPRIRKTRRRFTAIRHRRYFDWGGDRPAIAVSLLLLALRTVKAAAPALAHAPDRRTANDAGGARAIIDCALHLEAARTAIAMHIIAHTATASGDRAQ